MTPKSFIEGVAPSMLEEGRFRLKSYQDAIKSQSVGGGPMPKVGGESESSFKSLPKTPSEWEPGTLYQTPQGLLEWTGRYEGDKPVFKLPSVQSNEEARKLPKGTRFKGPDGNIYTR